MDRHSRATTGVITEVAAWAVLMFGVGLVTLSSVTPGDLELAAPSAVIAGLLAAAARRFIGGVVLELPPGAWGWALRVPVAAVSDTVTVLVFAVRSLRDRDSGGQLRTVQLPLDEDEDTAEARRALAALALAATSANITVDEDVQRRRIVIHELFETRPTRAAIDPAAPQ